MKKRKTPWGAIVVVVLMISGLAYAKMADLTPTVGTVEELQAREEERMKARAQEAMQQAPKALGDGREPPSTTSVAAAVKSQEKPMNLVDLKRKNIGKAPTPIIFAPQTKVKQDHVNEGQPFTHWYGDESGRQKLGK